MRAPTAASARWDTRRLKRGILRDDEVRILAKAVRAMLGEGVARLADSYNLNFEENIRFAAVRVRCVEAREKLGHSIRDVARTLEVPQYRLKDIESSRVSDIDPAILDRYLSYLGLKRWFRRWCTANSEFAVRLGIKTRRARE